MEFVLTLVLGFLAFWWATRPGVVAKWNQQNRRTYQRIDDLGPMGPKDQPVGPVYEVTGGPQSVGVVYKQVRVPAGNGKRTERVLNRYAKQGWTLLEIKRGGLLFGSRDTAIMFKPASS